MAAQVTFTEWLFSGLTTQLDLIRKQLRKMEKIMVENQARLDALSASVNEASANVVSELQALKDQVAAGQPLDFSGIDAAVAGLNASTDTVESGETPAEPPAQP